MDRNKEAVKEFMKANGPCQWPGCEETGFINVTVGTVTKMEDGTLKDMTHTEDPEGGEGMVTFPMLFCMDHMFYATNDLIRVEIDGDMKAKGLIGDFGTIRLMEVVMERTLSRHDRQKKESEGLDDERERPDD